MGNFRITEVKVEKIASNYSRKKNSNYTCKYRGFLKGPKNFFELRGFSNYGGSNYGGPTVQSFFFFVISGATQC